MTGELVASCEAVTDFVLSVPVLLVVIMAEAAELGPSSIPLLAEDDPG